jgi:type I restriction-modification system DNA methylase subunit
MAKRKAGNKKGKQAGNGENGGIVSLTKELFQAAITLCGSVEPADYKRYVLPIIFLRFLSLRYDRRRAELEALVADKNSDYHGDKGAIHDPDEYGRVGAFVIPEPARWENIRKAAQADDIKGWTMFSSHSRTSIGTSCRDCCRVSTPARTWTRSACAA